MWAEKQVRFPASSIWQPHRSPCELTNPHRLQPYTKLTKCAKTMWMSSGVARGGRLGAEGLLQGTGDDSKLRRDGSEEE